MDALWMTKKKKLIKGDLDNRFRYADLENFQTVRIIF